MDNVSFIHCSFSFPMISSQVVTNKLKAFSSGNEKYFSAFDRYLYNSDFNFSLVALYCVQISLSRKKNIKLDNIVESAPTIAVITSLYGIKSSRAIIGIMEVTTINVIDNIVNRCCFVLHFLE